MAVTGMCNSKLVGEFITILQKDRTQRGHMPHWFSVIFTTCLEGCPQKSATGHDWRERHGAELVGLECLAENKSFRRVDFVFQIIENRYKVVPHTCRPTRENADWSRRIVLVVVEVRSWNPQHSCGICGQAKINFYFSS